MLPLLLASCLALAPQTPAPHSVQEPAPPAAEAGLAAQRDADVHNYVVMRLRLIKRGAAVEEIKNEIVNQIDFGTLSPRSVDLLRRTMTLCDRVLANQAQLGSQLAAVEQERKQEDAKALGGLGKLALSGSTGALPLLLSALSDFSGSGKAGAHRAQLLAQSAADVGADISAMEFDLAVLRSQVQQEGHLDASEFVAPADYDAFLTAARLGSDPERVSGTAKALEGSPRLEPAALNLAGHFFAAQDSVNCIRYADLVIATAPRILRRDPLRAQARAYKACLALAKRDFPGAVNEADGGLEDDPSNAYLIKAKATGLVMAGDHAGALLVFEKLVLLMPEDSTAYYNLACCKAVAANDADGAMRAFRNALAKGFTDIAHAKTDPDLDLLRSAKADEFNSLTQLRLKIRLLPDRSLLPTSDTLEVTNESAFTLLPTELKLTFEGVPASRRDSTPTQRDQSVKVDLLAPGGVFKNRQLGRALHIGFTTVRVAVTGAQGEFERVYTGAELR